MLAFIIAMAVYSLLSILFAFRPPPRGVDNFFRVPSIFAFLPKRWVMPAGRVFVGACGMLVCVMMLPYV